MTTAVSIQPTGVNRERTAGIVIIHFVAEDNKFLPYQILNIRIKHIHIGSTPTNEVAINGNAPFAFVMGAVNALEYEIITGNSNPVIKDFAVYPVPAVDILNIDYTENCDFEIIDISGKLVSNGRLESGSINISELNAGVYLLRLFTKKKKQFIKK